MWLLPASLPVGQVAVLWRPVQWSGAEKAAGLELEPVASASAVVVAEAVAAVGAAAVVEASTAAKEEEEEEEEAGMNVQAYK